LIKPPGTHPSGETVLLRSDRRWSLFRLGAATNNAKQPPRPVGILSADRRATHRPAQRLNATTPEGSPFAIV